MLLSINDDSSVSDKNSITAEFVRFEYDVEKAAMAVDKSPLPNAYAESLRKGI